MRFGERKEIQTGGFNLLLQSCTTQYNEGASLPEKVLQALSRLFSTCGAVTSLIYMRFGFDNRDLKIEDGGGQPRTASGSEICLVSIVRMPEFIITTVLLMVFDVIERTSVHFTGFSLYKVSFFFSCRNLSCLLSCLRTNCELFLLKFIDGVE